jgi:outer membrane biosynthesis protein TonB
MPGDLTFTGGLDVNPRHRIIAGFAVLAALLLHGLLVWLLFQQTVVVAAPRPISVFLVRPTAVAAPKPKAVNVPVPKPVVHAPVPVAVDLKPQSRPREHHAVRRVVIPQPQIPLVPHFTPSTDSGLGLDLGPPASGSSNGQALLTGFDDAVKQRIEAEKTYPPGMAPYHGMTFWNECIVSYRVTVDRYGDLLGYKLYGCGNPFLDSATRAAILMASPFPVPPDFGGDHYDIYGSLIFKHP